jgi:NADPH:quinone reductase-like Zn-dependent oxidoreductase
VHAQTTQKQWQLVRNAAPAGGSGSAGQAAPAYSLKLATDVPVRKPDAGEVLVKIHAASLNRRDVFVMMGRYPMPPRQVVIPLSDGAGEVTAVGTGVKRFKTGDKVMPIFFPNWIEGRPAGNATEVSLGGAVDGVLSEYITISEQSLVAMPAGLSYEEAATLPCAAVTAWNGLVTRGHMQRGDYVLLEGTGGVSIFGLQFAVAAGAKPVITSSSDEKLAKAKALGAIGGVNYKTTVDWEKPILALTNGAGVQQALEVGGKDSLTHAVASLGPGGHIALIGGLGGFGGDVPAMALIGANRTVSGIYVGSRENFEAMNAFIVQHRLKPVIDKVFEFKDATAAYDYMENGSFFGKIVIRM